MCRAVKNPVAKCVTLVHHIWRSRVQVSSRILADPVFFVVPSVPSGQCQGSDPS